nr:OPT/YSL family transporter [Bizionia paragorgiae]
MMTLKLHRMTRSIMQQKTGTLVFFFVFFSLVSYAQVSSSIDSTSIKIGEEIIYKIEVNTDSTDLVVFPEGQSFSPLEMISSYEIDTTKRDATFRLIKKYGLTQFDSGAYAIPKQKIIINDKTFFTDSLHVEVQAVMVDTTKQGLYDIKPVMAVDKEIGDWWIYLLIAIASVALVAFLMYWFIWRQKPLTEAEEIALLPPYDRAKMALKKLDESNYLQTENLKEYYSELTFIIRKYLDEKVYDRALESTTDELVYRLKLLKDGNQIELSANDIKNIETILKRADLVKFAKSAPDVALAEMDRKTVDLEIDQVKSALPEPTEAEKLQDKRYKEEQERRKKNKKIVLTVVLSLALVFATLIGFIATYGFTYVKDTIIGHESKSLLEGNWVTSDYGYPPITISTPKVLKRTEVPTPEALKEQYKSTMFSYGSLIDKLNIVVRTTTFTKPQQQEMQTNDQEPEIDLNQAVDAVLSHWEKSGAINIVLNKEKFVTPRGAEGLKAFGTADLPSLLSDKTEKGKYAILSFTSQNILQQVLLSWKDNDDYAEDIIERILDSIELKPKAE